MEKETEKILKFLHYAEGLKKELRYLWLSNGRQESSAEHSWRMAVMIMLIVPKLKLRVNTEKAMKIALIHDVVEIEAKDTPLYSHFKNNKVKEEKRKRENSAISNILKGLGESGKEIYNLWHEYENQRTNEARLVKAIDKLESRLQFIEDDVKVYKSKEIKLMPEVADYFTKLCSIDPFLSRLEKSVKKERNDKIKIMKKNGRWIEED